MRVQFWLQNLKTGQVGRLVGYTSTEKLVEVDGILTWWESKYTFPVL